MDTGLLSLRVLRSSQSDAEQLDLELLSMFKESLNTCLGAFHSGLLVGHYRELLLILKSIIFGLTVARGRPSPGMSLLNLVYRNEFGSSSFRNEGPPLTRVQRLLLYLGDIIVPYAWSGAASLLVRRMQGGDCPGSNVSDMEDSSNGYSLVGRPGGPRGLACRLALQSSVKQAWKLMQSVELAWKGLELANHVGYMRNGRYRRLLERLVGARLVYRDVGASRHISFDYLNRQLIWSEVSDFILFLLPLLNAGCIGRLMNKYLPMNESMRGAVSSVGSEATCSVCETVRESPLRCQALPCKHAFCYYCMASRLAARKDPRCFVCSERIETVSMLP
jgi:peroxin-2